jgi:hypothetical protein
MLAEDSWIEVAQFAAYTARTRCGCARTDFGFWHEPN